MTNVNCIHFISRCSLITVVIIATRATSEYEWDKNCGDSDIINAHPCDNHRSWSFYLIWYFDDLTCVNLRVYTAGRWGFHSRNETINEFCNTLVLLTRLVFLCFCLCCKNDDHFLCCSCWSFFENLRLLQGEFQKDKNR